MERNYANARILISIFLLVTHMRSGLIISFTGSTPPRKNPSFLTQYVEYGPDVIIMTEGQDIPLNLTDLESSNEVQHIAINTSSLTETEIIINYIGAWTPDQISAMNYAASQWSQFIYSPVPIEIDVEWRTYISGVAGLCLCSTKELVNENAPYTHTYYPMTLANAITGTDNNMGSPEMILYFTPTYSWYFSPDGQTPDNQLDFVRVAMHEMGHGFLGDDSFVNYETNMVAWGGAQWDYTTYVPGIMDLYLVDSNGQNLTDTSIYPNPSTALFDLFSQKEVYFSGPATLGNNNNQAGKVDPPHLNMIYAGTQNSLMVGAVAYGESMHHPGPIVLGMLSDMGWQVTANMAPSIHLTSLVFVEKDSQIAPALDLWAYTSDTHSQPSALTYSIHNNPTSQAGVTLRENRYIDIVPESGWSGEVQVEIKAQDPEGLFSTAIFSVLVVENVYSVALPLIQY